MSWAEATFGDGDVMILGDLNADCTYDNFILSDSLTDEFTGDVGVFRFDTEYGLAQDAAEDVSDHYPVYAVFTK